MKKMFRFPFSRTLRRYFETRTLKCLLSGWVFSNRSVDLLVNELCDMSFNYLPVDIRGKVVLDVGAGEGESALFFLAHGAKKVVCVEANPLYFKNLIINSKRFSIVPVCKPFCVEMLNDFIFDFLKVDIEGYEECLLDVDLKVPAVIEVHGLQLRDKFRDRGFRVADSRVGFSSEFQDCCTTYAFWQC